MRWNCLHCLTSLSVADEDIGANWAFTRCYHCGGLCMARRPEVSLVKVDRVPEGEPIINAEASDAGDPQLFSEAANRNLARYTGPVVRPAARRNGMPIPEPGPQPVLTPRLPEVPPQLRAQPATPIQATYTLTPRTSGRPASSPPPAPATPVAASTKTLAPPSALPPSMPKPPPAAQVAAPFTFPEPLPEIAAYIAPRPKLLPIAMGIAGAIAVGTGIYGYLQSQSLWEKTRARASGRQSSRLSQLTMGAMAPSGASVITPITMASATPLAANRSPADASGNSNPSGLTDSMHQTAMAPDRNPSPATLTPAATTAARPPAPAMIIRTRRDDTKLRSGPGVGYPVIAVVDENVEFTVSNWSEHWFKIQLPENRDPSHPMPYERKFAWVETEVVQVIPASESGRTYAPETANR